MTNITIIIRIILKSVHSRISRRELPCAACQRVRYRYPRPFCPAACRRKRPGAAAASLGLPRGSAGRNLSTVACQRLTLRAAAYWCGPLREATCLPGPPRATTCRCVLPRSAIANRSVPTSATAC